jgi:hypothetical protein
MIEIPNCTHGGEMKRKMAFLKAVSLFLGLVVVSVVLCREQAQSGTLKYEWIRLGLYPRIGLPAR